MASTAAQDEFNALFNKSSYNTGKSHPEDARSSTPRANGHGSDTSRSPSPAQSFLNLEDDDEDTAEDLAVKAMRGTYYIPRATRQANTGPKGVIADAQAFEQARRQAQSVRSVAQRPRQSYSQSNSRSPPAMVEDEKSSEEDEDDERFLESWRQKRLLELNQKSVSGMLGRGGKKVYGHLQRVDAEGFLNAVEGSPADTVVIVLIHDHSVCIPSLGILSRHAILTPPSLTVRNLKPGRRSSPRNGQHIHHIPLRQTALHRSRVRARRRTRSPSVPQRRQIRRFRARVR